MMQVFKHIEENYGFKINHTKQLSGGDISQVFLLITTEGKMVVKINALDKKPMFITEQRGLLEISSKHIFKVPEVIGVNEIHSWSYILLEYIPRGEPKVSTFKVFGAKLAQLHNISADNFGWTHANYIGALPQSNTQYPQWSIFYYEQRILPQYKLAVKNKLIEASEVPHPTACIAMFDEVFEPTPPSLLHGDLWNGNYMIDDMGQAILIDPAVYYGHPMIDIGMTQLFGGFSKDFYEAYSANMSLSGDWEAQIELAQWYYLLVHLNLFGKSYLSRVNHIKTKYLNG